MTEPVKVQIHQQAERVKCSFDTSTQESRNNETDGNIIQELVKANLKKERPILLDFLTTYPDQFM